MSETSAPVPPPQLAEYLSKFDLKDIAAKIQLFLNIKGAPAAWERVKSEPMSVKDIYQRYIVPVSVILGLCSFIGLSLFGPVSIMSGLMMFVKSVLQTLIGTYVIMQLLKAMAPGFGASVSEENALKLLVFSALPLAPIGALTIIPLLIPLLLLLLLAGAALMLYLMWVGLPVMTGVSTEKQPGLFIAFVASVILLGAVVSWLMATIF